MRAPTLLIGLTLVACGGDAPPPQAAAPTAAPPAPALDPNRPRSRAAYEQRRRDEADARAGLQPGEVANLSGGGRTGAGPGPEAAPDPACEAGVPGALVVVHAGQRKTLPLDALLARGAVVPSGRHAGSPGVAVSTLIGPGPATVTGCGGSSTTLDPSARAGLWLVRSNKGALKLVDLADGGKRPVERAVATLEGDLPAR